MSNYEILIANRFYLNLQLEGSHESTDGIFLECKGFQKTQDVIEICEVTPEAWGSGSKGRLARTKLPGNVKVNNLTLRRGMSFSTAFWQWFQAVETGNWFDLRKDGSLSIYDQGAKEVARFEFAQAWPTRYMIGDVNARSTEIEMEEVEIAFEHLDRTK